MRILPLFASIAISGVLFLRNKYLTIRCAPPGKKVATVARLAANTKLDDDFIAAMLDVVSKETIGLYCVNEDTILKAGLKLARHGTPESCLLAIHLSNYSGVKYPEETNEVLREAACLFVPVPDYSPMSRIIEIVRGKYLYAEIIRPDSPHQTDQVQSY